MEIAVGNFFVPQEDYKPKYHGTGVAKVPDIDLADYREQLESLTLHKDYRA
jgi:hypothetical protein